MSIFNIFKRKAPEPVAIDAPKLTDEQVLDIAAERIAELATKMGFTPPKVKPEADPKIQEMEAGLSWQSLAPGQGRGQRSTVARFVKDNPFGKPWAKLMDEGQFDQVLAEMQKPYEQLLREYLGETSPMTVTELAYVQATTKTILVK